MHILLMSFVVLSEILINIYCLYAFLYVCQRVKNYIAIFDADKTTYASEYEHTLFAQTVLLCFPEGKIFVQS